MIYNFLTFNFKHAGFSTKLITFRGRNPRNTSSEINYTEKGNEPTYPSVTEPMGTAIGRVAGGSILAAANEIHIRLQT